MKKVKLMNRSNPSLIDELTSDLEPVQPIRLWQGVALVIVSALATIALVETFDGLWTGALQGHASTEYFITNGMLALLGAAASFAVIKMGSPHVGNSHDGARWSALMVALLPLTAAIVLGISGLADAAIGDTHGFECFLAGSGFGLVVAGALTAWLRRGAPVSLTSAGTYTGIAAGAIGSFAYGLACPIDDIGHLGIWHIAPVIVSGIVGRFAIPPLVRW